jgi:hypothetical protein
LRGADCACYAVLVRRAGSNHHAVRWGFRAGGWADMQVGEERATSYELSRTANIADKTRKFGASAQHVWGI